MVRFLLLLISSLLISVLHAEDLRIPLRGGGDSRYFQSLLEVLAKEGDQGQRLQFLPEMANRRADVMLERGELDVYWYIRTPQRDQRFLLVDVPLTEGFIGRRILMTRPDLLPRFANIRTLDQLRESGLTALMGGGWADIAIWREAGLAVREQVMTTRELYRQVASGIRGSDYFARGSIEVMPEQAIWAGLKPVPGLVLSYPGDFYFYVSPRKPELQRWLQTQLLQAEKSGLRHRLFVEHYGKVLGQLEMARRHEIRLR